MWTAIHHCFVSFQSVSSSNIFIQRIQPTWVDPGVYLGFPSSGGQKSTLGIAPAPTTTMSHWRLLPDLRRTMRTICFNGLVFSLLKQHLRKLWTFLVQDVTHTDTNVVFWRKTCVYKNGGEFWAKGCQDTRMMNHTTNDIIIRCLE